MKKHTHDYRVGERRYVYTVIGHTQSENNLQEEAFEDIWTIATYDEEEAAQIHVDLLSTYFEEKGSPKWEVWISPYDAREVELCETTEYFYIKSPIVRHVDEFIELFIEGKR